MFYQYRQLTPEEREQIVQLRRERGYPLHAPPHPYRDAGTFLITGANYEHKPIMDNPLRRTEFELQLLDVLRGIQAELCAWVILPNHYHFIASVKHLDLISLCIKQLHGTTARAWNLEDGMTGTRRVWYKYSDRRLRNEDHFYRALNYVHVNPVKHGYVRDPYDWLWTSLENYRTNLGRDWLRENWKLHPPGDFCKGWDD